MVRVRRSPARRRSRSPRPSSRVIVHHLVLAELDRLAGVLDEGGDVGGDEVLAVADARPPAASCAGRPPPCPARAASTATRVKAPSSRLQTARIASARSAPGLDLRAQQLGGDLGVGLGDRARCPAAASSARSSGEVLDDAVVDDGHPAVRRGVRVGVGVGWRRRGWPTGCGRCPDRRRGSGSSASPSPGWRACRPAWRRGSSSVGDQRDAGGVVAAVLQPAQPVDHDARPPTSGPRTRRFHTWRNTLRVVDPADRGSRR